MLVIENGQRGKRWLSKASTNREIVRQYISSNSKVKPVCFIQRKQIHWHHKEIRGCRDIWSSDNLYDIDYVRTRATSAEYIHVYNDVA